MPYLMSIFAKFSEAQVVHVNFSSKINRTCVSVLLLVCSHAYIFYSHASCTAMFANEQVRKGLDDLMLEAEIYENEGRYFVM